VNRQQFLKDPKKARAKRRKKLNPKKVKTTKFTKTIGKAWVGRWNNGVLGWGMSHHIHPNMTGSILEQKEHPWFWDWHDGKGEKSDWNKVWLCKVTVEQVFDHRGRPIVRYKKKKK
jgi:hypothetical protein